jgi:hypothetical protein
MIAEIVAKQKNYRPGETISGSVSWVAEKQPKKAELRFFWHTRGKGDRDAGLVESVSFELPQSSDHREFEFRAPDFPPSFSGKLISLIWGLELVLEPGESFVTEIVIAPNGVELSLDHAEWIQTPEIGKFGNFSFKK